MTHCWNGNKHALGAALRPADPADHFKADDVGNERKLHLFGLFGRTAAKIPYRCDFGNIWEHRIVLETLCHPLLI